MVEVAFDVETTGLSVYRDHRIIEIGAVKLENGEITDEFRRLINPGIEVPRSARKIHVGD